MSLITWMRHAYLSDQYQCPTCEHHCRKEDIGHHACPNAEGQKRFVLPIPPALYSCRNEWCAAERSWSADNLHWSERLQGWYCGECWEFEFHGKKGTTLEAEILRQNATVEQRPDMTPSTD